MDLSRAVSVLQHDGLVIYPTETVYGLGADALSEEAIRKVYEAKQRPLSMPVSIAVSGFDMLHAVARADPSVEPFLSGFLPGPVTVVLPARNCVPAMLTGGTGLIGIRMPAHDLARQLIEMFDSPITATSANLHGAKEPVIPAECTVPHEFLIDGGRLPGTPSTVVDPLKKEIIRAGADVDRVAQFLLTM